MKKSTILSFLIFILSIGVFTGCNLKETKSDRAYFENGTIYITEDGETYPYDAGIYYDDEEGKGFVWFDLGKDNEGNLYDQKLEFREYIEYLGCDGNTDVAISKIKSGTLFDETESFYPVDMLGQKLEEYYPNEGVWGDEENGYYVYTYNGKGLYLENYTPPQQR